MPENRLGVLSLWRDETMTFKQIQRSVSHHLLKALVPTAGFLFFYGLGATLRVRLFGEAEINALRANYPNMIYVGWHEHVLTNAWVLRGRQIAILVSQSRDGEYLARLNRLLGFYSVRGSSTRGGVRGFLQLTDALRGGHDVVIGVDGPKGPLHECKAGPALLAKHSGMPIIPLAGCSSRSLRLKSWDRTIVSLPFSTISVMCGAPIFVPHDADKETIAAYQRRVADALNALTVQIERQAAAERESA